MNEHIYIYIERERERCKLCNLCNFFPWARREGSYERLWHTRPDPAPTSLQWGLRHGQQKEKMMHDEALQWPNRIFCTQTASWLSPVVRARRCKHIVCMFTYIYIYICLLLVLLLLHAAETMTNGHPCPDVAYIERLYVYVYKCMYVHMYMHTHVHIYIYIYICFVRCRRQVGIEASSRTQDSSKRGAMETECSGSHYILGCFII